MNRQIVVTIVFSILIALILPQNSFGQSDWRARHVAEETIEAMGGMDAWTDHRYLVWDIFGQTHYWDKWNGDFRWEADSLTVLMNVQSKEGDAWIDGDKIEDPARRNQILERAYARWVNNSYWLIMPFKLLDPGVNLKYVGTDTSQAGDVSDVIELTFNDVGLTPDNKYRVFVDRKSGLVCQWQYFENRTDEEPSMTTPWNQWKEYDGVWMSTGRGEDRRGVTNLALPEELPRSIFTDPKPVEWQPASM